MSARDPLQSARSHSPPPQLTAPPSLPSKPEARTHTTSDLLDRAIHGRMRVPPFQRNFRWEPSHIHALFDSLYRGYPIGTLLMWRRPAPPAQVVWGAEGWSALSILSPGAEDTWWIVDGQQRVTSLVAAMHHPHPWGDPKDPFAVFFDLEQQRFSGHPNKPAAPRSPHLPVSLLRDATELGLWSSQWLQSGGDLSQVRLAHEVGKRLREYSLPLYIVETSDEQVLREIFHRTNNAGKRLEATEVFNALFHHSASSPTGIDGVARDLSKLGMGQVKPARALQAILALEGLDVTRRAEDQVADRARFSGKLPALAAAFAKTLAFLREDAKIPHLDLLPYNTPLTILTRFFDLHPDPHPRNRHLLVRWVWRGMLSGAHDSSQKTNLRHAVAAITDSVSESACVQRLLKTVPQAPERSTFHDLFFESAAFDPRSAQCRIGALSLAHLRPRHLLSGEVIDLNDLFNQHHKRAFLKLNPDGERHILNILLHPPLSPAQLEDAISQRARPLQPDEVLASHGLSTDGARHPAFFADIAPVNALAEWGANDRPPIAHLLSDDSDEEDAADD